MLGTKYLLRDSMLLINHKFRFIYVCVSAGTLNGKRFKLLLPLMPSSNSIVVLCSKSMCDDSTNNHL